MPCCEISDRAQMSKTIIAVVRWSQSLETAVNKCLNPIPVSLSLMFLQISTIVFSQFLSKLAHLMNFVEVDMSNNE